MENKQKKSLSNFNFDFRKYAMFIALVAIAIFFQISTDGVLLKPMNVSKLIMQNSYILILAIGMLPCILTGNIDLAVGSILGMVSAIAGTLLVEKGFSVPATILICLVIGILVGAWQGMWIAYVRVPAFIVTLAGMLIFKGITMVILNGNTLAPFPESYQYLASGFVPEISKIGGFSVSSIIIAVILIAFLVFNDFNKRKQDLKYNLETMSFNRFLLKIILEIAIVLFALYWMNIYKGIPFILVILTVLVAIYTFITQRTTLGRSIYAFGGNERATKLSGINTNRVFFLTYVNMGILAALAGIVFSARLNAAAPSAGSGLELDAIAACYIGGASASGGVGTIVGAIIGGLVMGILNNGMSIMGIGIDWQQAIKGLVLLIAVAFDIISRRKKG
ncbi:sugar ABC transporter permease [Peptostreptococcaceae bacterium OttesenSCG-928-C18]|nr:sugar ABC transporter permease [Peptostreptococcaceae bacterium OttesenSCG-928-C18]